MRIFTKVDGNLVLDREEIALIKEFNNLLRRCNPCNEDKDGTKKIMNFKEFNYIYHICDYHSYPNQNGLTDKEAHVWSADVVGLPKEWKPDDTVKFAINRYKQIHKSPARELAHEIITTLHLSTKLTKKLRETIEAVIEQEDVKGEELNQLVNNLRAIITLSADLPKQIKGLQETKELIDKEEDKKEIKRGGEEVSDSMNPDNDVEK